MIAENTPKVKQQLGDNSAIAAKAIVNSMMPAFVVRRQETTPTLPKHAQIDPALGAGAAPWLDEYIKFSERWAPSAFGGYHEAVGLFVLSTLAARRVAYPMGRIRYTSLYLLLLGRTSIFTKTTAAEIGTAVINAAGLGFLRTPDEMTPQAFVDHLSKRPVPSNWEQIDDHQMAQVKQRLAFPAQRGWYYDELGMKVSAMMNDKGHMSDYRGLLRKFDDGGDKYEYHSIGRGINMVEQPYLSLLGNMTPADLQPFAGKGSALWNDGFWARFIFVSPGADTERCRGRFPNELRHIPATIVDPLKEWHTRLGIPNVQIQLGEELTVNAEPVEASVLGLGAGVYDAYYRYYDALIDMVQATDNSDLDGNYSRLPEKAMRVAALLASLQGSPNIELSHWARAQTIAEKWRANLHDLYQALTGGVEYTKRKGREEAICDYLAKKGTPLTRREIIQGVRNVTAADLHELIPAMLNAELITEIKSDKSAKYMLLG